ncbi:hypothetical protein [Ferrimicrobium sp.]|jgi:Flp pilus assembly protein TadB|uniref:hypothetical protein n=1 Tax=Ferrimicrobium sp. TaxID=2926050 RepID=UPI00260DE7A1|nr:hypothetical protein [Ferrimicrobium sp.]MCL5973388.1 hypothetical protein [Actinomycetota bacterium]
MGEISTVIGLILVLAAVAGLVVSFVVWRKHRQPTGLMILRSALTDREQQREAFAHLKAGTLPDDPHLAEVVVEVAQATVTQWDPSPIFAVVLVLLIGEYLMKPAGDLIVIGLVYVVVAAWGIQSRRKMRERARLILTSTGN